MAMKAKMASLVSNRILIIICTSAVALFGPRPKSCVASDATTRNKSAVNPMIFVIPKNAPSFYEYDNINIKPNNTAVVARYIPADYSSKKDVGVWVSAPNRNF